MAKLQAYKDEFQADFTDYSQLSYVDEGKTHVTLLIDGTPVARLLVYRDAEENDREYVCINYEILYLDTLTEITPK